MIVTPFTRHRGAGHRGVKGGEGGGTGAPFRGVKGVLRSHTAHQEGCECLVSYVNQGKAGGVSYYCSPTKDGGGVSV